MIQKVKRDPAFEKGDRPDGFEALDIRLAAALKGALSHPLCIIIPAKEKTLRKPRDVLYVEDKSYVS